MVVGLVCHNFNSYTPVTDRPTPLSEGPWTTEADREPIFDDLVSLVASWFCQTGKLTGRTGNPTLKLWGDWRQAWQEKETNGYNRVRSPDLNTWEQVIYSHWKWHQKCVFNGFIYAVIGGIHVFELIHLIFSNRTCFPAWVSDFFSFFVLIYLFFE